MERTKKKHTKSVRSAGLANVLIRGGAELLYTRPDHERYGRIVYVFNGGDQWIFEVIDKYYRHGRLGVRWDSNDEKKYIALAKERIEN